MQSGQNIFTKAFFTCKELRMVATAKLWKSRNINGRMGFCNGAFAKVHLMQLFRIKISKSLKHQHNPSLYRISKKRNNIFIAVQERCLSNVEMNRVNFNGSWWSKLFHKGSSSLGLAGWTWSRNWAISASTHYICTNQTPRIVLSVRSSVGSEQNLPHHTHMHQDQGS